MLLSRFVRAYPPATPPEGAPALYLPFLKGELVLEGNALPSTTRFTDTSLPLLAHDNPDDTPLYLGTLDGRTCLALVLPEETTLPEGYQRVGIRALYGRVDEAEYALAGYASQMLQWRRISGFCGSCGNRTQPKSGDWGRECRHCRHTMYPPVSPAVLALVHDGGDRALLATKTGWGTRYSILAGFVEPGESLEECVAREVGEEVGVSVTDIVYQGSQPWPFPHQVMIGFTACYAGGEIVLDEAELSHAAWFRYDELPDLPAPLSLSRQLIDTWVRSRRDPSPPPR